MEYTILMLLPFLVEQIGVRKKSMFSFSIQGFADIKPIGQPLPLGAEVFQIGTAIIVQPFGVRVA